MMSTEAMAIEYHPITTVPRDGSPVILRDEQGREIAAEVKNGTVSTWKSAAPRPKLYVNGKLNPLLRWRRLSGADKARSTS